MKKRQLIFWMVMGVVLVGCGQGKVTRDGSEQPLEKVAKKEGSSSLERMNEEKKAASPKKKDKKPSEQKTDSVYPKEYDDPKGNDKTNKNQSPQKIVQYGTDNARLFPAKLKFVNGSSIDVRDINPYKNLPYKAYRKDPDGFEHFYDLTDMSRAGQDEILKGCRINPDALRNSNYLRIFAKSPVVELSDSLVAIAYHIAYYSNEEDILGTQGITILYDNAGNEITRIEDKKDGFYDIRLSSDGKYLMQKYGTNYGEDGGGQLDTGFRFYDTETGERIYEWEQGKDPFIKNYGFIKEQPFLATSFRFEKDYFDYYVYDLLSNSTYFFRGSREKFRNHEFMQQLFAEVISDGNSESLLKQNFKKIK